MEDLSSAIRSEQLTAPAGVRPMLSLAPACPRSVVETVFRVLVPALEAQGWDAHFRSGTGLAVLWIRPAVAMVPR